MEQFPALPMMILSISKWKIALTTLEGLHTENFGKSCWCEVTASLPRFFQTFPDSSETCWSHEWPNSVVPWAPIELGLVEPAIHPGNACLLARECIRESCLYAWHNLELTGSCLTNQNKGDSDSTTPSHQACL